MFITFVKKLFIPFVFWPFIKQSFVIIFFQEEDSGAQTTAQAAQKLGDISSDEGVNDDKPQIDDSAAGAAAGGCDFDMVRFSEI